MSCRFTLIALAAVLFLGFVPRTKAAAYSLSDGTTVEGEPISFDPRGVVVKKPDGELAPRVGWTNFTQEALKEFFKNPKAKSFVEPYVDVDESDADKKPVLEIKPKAIQRVDRPAAKAGFGSIFSSPLSQVLLLILWSANIYAGFEIGIFRNYHPGLVAGISAVAPLVGPVLFLCLPTRMQKSHDELAAESMAHHDTDHGAPTLSVPGSHPAEADGEAPVEAAPSRVTTYLRGQTTFNRRFFETKFAGFLKVVPGDAEKDMVIFIRSARGEHSGNRLTRILQNELHFQVAKGDATADVIIPFAEIYEVQVKPKDA